MHAIVFLPGILGTRLVHDDREIWPPDLADVATGYRHTDALLSARTHAGEIIDKVACKPIYSGLLSDLEDIAGPASLVDERFIVPFPYDWRRDIRATARDLGRHLTELHREGTDGFILVGHSMGGLICRLALEGVPNDEGPWRDAVTHLVTLGTPHRGAPVAVARAMGLEATMTIQRNDLRRLAQSEDYPSLYQLFPPPGQRVARRTRGGGEEALDLFDEATAGELGLSLSNLEVARVTHAALASGHKPEHVEYMFWAASGHKTALRIEGDARFRKVEAGYAGDGTVPLWSALDARTRHDVAFGEHGSFFNDYSFREAFYTALGARLPARPFAEHGRPRIMVSVDQLTYEPDAAIDVLLVPEMPATRIDGELRLERTPDATREA